LHHTAQKKSGEVEAAAHTMGKDNKKHSKESEKSHKHKKDHKHQSKHSDKGRSDNKDSERRRVDAPITEDDFFNKSEEFRVWLKLAKNEYFEDLSSKEARKLFEKEFMKDFNKGKLSSMYYDGKRVKLLNCDAP
jgi:ABC-type Zn2+ transport system substrate-binding protein/surface adhesin